MKKSKKERVWQPYVLVLIFCSLLAVVFFTPFLRGARSFTWDTQEFGFPYLNFVTRTIAETGRLPLWNQYNFSGYSFAGDIETGMFYPVNWLFSFMFGGVSFSELPYYFIFHFALGAFFAYLLCFRLSKNVFASLLGAVTFAYSGYALGHISHLGQVTMYMWIPAVVLAFIYAMDKRKLYAVLLAGTTLGTALLIGHPNTSLYLIYLLGGLVLTLTIANLKNWKQVLLSGISAIVFGLIVAAILILPVMDLTLKSNRLSLTYSQQSTNFSLFPADTAGFINPDTNHLLDPNPKAAFKGTADLTQSYLYFGLIPLFALIFVFLTKGWQKWFFGSFALLALLLGFGNFTPLNKIFFDFVPGFNKVRMAAQVMAIFFFAVSVLSALGAAKILSYIKEDKKRVVLSSLVGFLLLTLTVADIFGHAYNKDFYSTPKNPASVYDSPGEVAFVNKFKNDSAPQRIHDETNVIIPNKWMYYGVENIYGNGGVKLAEYDQLFKKTGRTSREPVSDNLLDFLNVKFLITERVVAKNHFRKIEGNIYENLTVLPRAYLVQNFVVEQDKMNQLEIIKNDKINYHDSVLLASKPVYLGDSSIEPADNVSIIKRDGFNLELHVSSVKDSILVLSETYDTGWQLTVDKSRENFLLANAVFRAVPLKAGHHNVVFRYVPSPFMIGRMISVLAVAILIIAAALSFRKRLKKR
jgi:hypothetical protein